jgi:hypothetical protein
MPVTCVQEVMVLVWARTLTILSAHDFPQFLQVNTRIVPKIRPITTSFYILSNLLLTVIWSFSGVLSELLILYLNYKHKINYHALSLVHHITYWSKVVDVSLYVWNLFIEIFVRHYALYLYVDAPWHMTTQLTTSDTYDFNTVSRPCSWSMQCVCIWIKVVSGPFVSFLLVCDDAVCVLYLGVLFVFTFYWFTEGHTQVGGLPGYSPSPNPKPEFK